MGSYVAGQAVLRPVQPLLLGVIGVGNVMQGFENFAEGSHWV